MTENHPKIAEAGGLHLLEQVQISTADNQHLRAAFQPYGPAPGLRATDIVDVGNVDDGAAMNAPEMVRVQLVG